MDNERRAFKRFAQTLKVSYTVLSGIGATPFEYGVAKTIDISRSGLKIIVDEEISVPMLVQLNITVPTRSYGLFVLGKAVYCAPQEAPAEGFDVGVKFVGLLPADLEKILIEVDHEEMKSWVQAAANKSGPDQQE